MLVGEEEKQRNQQQQEEEVQHQLVMKISDIKIGTRLRKKVTSVESLASSIANKVLLHPVVVDEQNNLIAGFRRIKAYELLGRTEIPARRVKIQNALQGEYDENVERAGFALEDIAAIYEQVQKTRIGHRPATKKTREVKEKEEEENGSNNVSNVDTLSSSSSSSSSASSFPVGPSLVITGKLAGHSKGIIADILKITKLAKENPDRRLELPYDNRTYSQIVQAVDTVGKPSISKACSLMTHNEELLKVRAELAQSARGKSLPDKARLLNMDCTKLITSSNEIVEDNSIDLILTDPPFGQKYFHLLDALAQIACMKLKRKGCLAFTYGQYHLPKLFEIFAKYSSELSYIWEIAVKYETPSSNENKNSDYSLNRQQQEEDTYNVNPATPVPARGIRSEWKPLLVYCKGERRLLQNSIHIHDFIVSKKPDKLKHPWAQSTTEAKYMTEMLTFSEDATILDPFMGSGTFLVPAIRMGRYVVGLEADKVAYQTAISNIKCQAGVAKG